MPMSRFELHIPVFRQSLHFSDDIFRVGRCRVLLFLSCWCLSCLSLSGRLAFFFLLLPSLRMKSSVSSGVTSIAAASHWKRHSDIVRQTADSGHVGALSVSLQSECFVIQFHRLGDGGYGAGRWLLAEGLWVGVSAQDSDSLPARWSGKPPWCS